MDPVADPLLYRKTGGASRFAARNSDLQNKTHVGNRYLTDFRLSLTMFAFTISLLKLQIDES